MTGLENQILETCHIHNRIMLFTLEHLPDEALKATLSKRGVAPMLGYFISHEAHPAIFC